MSQAGMPVMTMRWMLLVMTMHRYASIAGCLLQLAASAVAMLSLGIFGLTMAMCLAIKPVADVVYA
jgi:hypothetical protein